MGTPGAVVLKSDGSVGLQSDGSVALFNTSGENACCCGCPVFPNPMTDAFDDETNESRFYEHAYDAVPPYALGVPTIYDDRLLVNGTRGFGAPTYQHARRVSFQPSNKSVRIKTDVHYPVMDAGGSASASIISSPGFPYVGQTLQFIRPPHLIGLSLRWHSYIPDPEVTLDVSEIIAYTGVGFEFFEVDQKLITWNTSEGSGSAYVELAVGDSIEIRADVTDVGTSIDPDGVTTFRFGYCIEFLVNDVIVGAEKHITKFIEPCENLSGAVTGGTGAFDGFTYIPLAWDNVEFEISDEPVGTQCEGCLAKPEYRNAQVCTYSPSSGGLYYNVFLVQSLCVGLDMNHYLIWQCVDGGRVNDEGILGPIRMSGQEPECRDVVFENLTPTCGTLMVRICNTEAGCLIAPPPGGNLIGEGPEDGANPTTALDAYRIATVCSVSENFTSLIWLRREGVGEHWQHWFEYECHNGATGQVGPVILNGQAAECRELVFENLDPQCGTLTARICNTLSGCNGIDPVAP